MIGTITLVTRPTAHFYVWPDVWSGGLVIHDRTRPTCRPELRFKDVCKRDMKACDMDTSSWETAVHNRTTWRKITHDGMKKNDKKHRHKWQEKRNKPPPQPPADPALKCNNYNKVCGSRIRLHCHRICCIQKWLLRRSHHCQTWQMVANNNNRYEAFEI